MLSIAAVAGLAPRALAKSIAAPVATPTPAPSTPFAIRPDIRAVARRADSV